jgi:signal peptidase I
MSWKPHPLGAAGLGFVLTPLAFLYLNQAKLALLWVVGLLLAIAVVMLGYFSQESFELGSLALGLAVAVYAYRRARAMEPTGKRPTVTHKSFLVGCALGFVAVALLFRTFVLEPYRIPSTSMTPTLVPGDRILVDKWNKQLERGDIIAFDYPLSPGETHIARVLGLPGDQLVIKDSRVTVNGTPAVLKQKADYVDANQLKTLPAFDESVGSKAWSIVIDAEKRVQPQASAHCKVYADQAMHCVVPAGHYFMMGDHRENANDSRSWGMLAQQHVVGKLVRTFH